jgi:hypothetical protein
VDQVLGEEQDALWEDLQEQVRFDENKRREREGELRSYREDTAF